MARYFDVHPVDPQPRLVAQLVDLLAEGALVALPTDSGYALACSMENPSGKDRILRIRKLDDKHHFTLICSDFAQLGQFVQLDNSVFRAVKAALPGRYTFILPGTKEVPRRLLHAKKKTVGVRMATTPVVREILRGLGEPLMTSTLILPGETEPMTEGWLVKDELDNQLDAVVDTGECGIDPTTVIDWSDSVPEVIRVGAGDPTPFE